MNAKEAKELTLWNKLSNIIRNRIKEAVIMDYLRKFFIKTVKSSVVYRLG